MGGAGGWNGGGNGETSGGAHSGGGGGGASDMRLNGTALGDRILVAGGGGGPAYNYGAGDDGGYGGGLTGGNGYSNFDPNHVACGRGGSQASGGAPGQYPGWPAGTWGVLGTGGTGAVTTSGGGGGGGGVVRLQRPVSPLLTRLGNTRAILT
ncbi:MAG: glycine-rich protein, partial [Planctomycetota bacterium]|nr:glycine-rich protein [Planctomycetota bacterium]